MKMCRSYQVWDQNIVEDTVISRDTDSIRKGSGNSLFHCFNVSYCLDVIVDILLIGMIL